MSSPILPLCLLIPAGPGASELTRVADLLESCAAYGDVPLCAVIINDGNDAHALELAGQASNIPTVVLPNARRGRGDWATGGLCTALMDAFVWIARNLPCAGVLRLDSDALVINPYASQITEAFARDPAIGLLGNFDSADGLPVPPGHIMTTRLYWRSKLVSHDREQHRLIFSLWGWRKRIRLLIHRARANGYVMGDWCQGGAYAVSPSFLQRLERDATLNRPEDFLDVDFGEDLLMALVVCALGLKLAYTSGPSRLFASKWKGLFGSPEALVQAGHGIIHSLKDHEGRTELATRAFFRARREHTATH